MKVRAIFQREIFGLLVTPTFYCILAGYTLLAVYFFFSLLYQFNTVVGRFRQAGAEVGIGAPNLNQWVIEPYFLSLALLSVFFVPLITMRIIAEERRSGTFELLMTSPVSSLGIVLGKYFGAIVTLFIIHSISFLLPLLLYYFADPVPEFGPFLTATIGILLLSASFSAIGIAISAMTDSQVVAGMSSVVTLLIIYAMHSPAGSLPEPWKGILEYCSPLLQLKPLFQGLLTLDAIVYFISLSLIGVAIAHGVIRAERWR